MAAMGELHEYAARRDGVFCLADARSFDLTDAQIRRQREREWRTLFDGVYIYAGAPLTPRALLRAACLAAAPNAAVSHRSGAFIYEVPGGRADLAELTSFRWLRCTQPGLIVHESNRIDPVDIRLIDGIPVMRPERVLIELASIYRSPDFIETVLHAMRRKRLVTYDSTVATFQRLAKRGRGGIRVTRTVLERWDPNLKATESPPETALFQILRSAALGTSVVPQFEILDEKGVFVARPDVALPERKIAVEYDSDQEHTDEISLARDNARRNRLMAHGWIVVIARRADVRSGGAHVIAAIRAHLSRPKLA
jgi:very-short-patch-repair endonuclease